MSKSLTIVPALGTALSLIFAAGWVLAGEDRPGPRGPRMMENMMQQMDVDKDGSVTRTEFDEFGKKRGQEHFARLDSNKDGNVTLEEFSKARSDRADRHFSRLDRDSNSIIDKTEMMPPRFGQHSRSGRNPNANGGPEKL